MSLLYIGKHGQDVKHLQTLLKKYDPGLIADGIFGAKTDRAVRLMQRRRGLYPPDGVAGPITMHALGATSAAPAARPAAAPTHAQPKPATPASGDPGPLTHAIAPARKRAQHTTMPPGVVSPVANMFTSRLGRQFIISHESQRGVSNHLHHPSAGSGVTIGPGYDMKDRSVTEVQRDLLAINVPADAAAIAAKGAGLSGSAASKFVSDNKKVLDLTTAQETALLGQIIGHYESMVKRAIKIPLLQQEFDALVSYAYNPGGGWTKATRLVNDHKAHDAMVEIKRHVTSKKQVIRSLVVRREAESRMFLYGEYK
jgi:GH24 family phage-related lysozyme (muramidase)